MFSEIDRDALRLACKMNGGIRHNAELADIDDGNLSKWLRGAPTLSDEKILSLLSVLGLPEGKADISRVHDWSLPLTLLVNLAPALQLFFPSGAEMAEAPWASPQLKNVLSSYVTRKSPKNLFAFTDGRVRAVFRSSKEVTLHPEHYRKSAKWRDGDRKNAILELSPNSEWTHRTPTIREFDDVWNGTQSPATLNDLDEAVKREQISYEVAIKRVSNKK